MRNAIVTLVLVIGVSGQVFAEPPVSAFSDLWTRLKSGDRVFVTDGSGLAIDGVFAKASDSTLGLLVDGQVRDIPAADVREISRRGDSLWNGFLIGAGIGAALGAVAYASCDDAYGECTDQAASAAIGAVSGALIYGGIGALIDHFIKGRTVVFRVKSTAFWLRPGIERGGAALSLALSR